MKKLLKLFLLIFTVILLDQITKGVILYLISGKIPVFYDALKLVPYPHLYYKINSFFNIVFTWNPGTAFSMFRNIGESFQIIIIVFTSIIIGFLGHYLFFKSKSIEKIPLALIIGGAIGNLIDRIRFGMVIDFLDFHIKSLHWPAFNIADSFIVLGICIYFINFIFIKRIK